MSIPEHVLDIFLQPGDYFWGDADTRIRTILGSCVSLILWHPTKKEGGMCHMMLPARPNKRAPHEPLDGKYGNEAWELFRMDLERTKTKPSEYVVKMFGGASMFDIDPMPGSNIHHKLNMGERNIEMAKKIIIENKLNLVSNNVGGTNSRRIHFDVWSGNVWLKRQ